MAGIEDRVIVSVYRPVEEADDWAQNLVSQAQRQLPGVVAARTAEWYRVELLKRSELASMPPVTQADEPGIEAEIRKSLPGFDEPVEKVAIRGVTYWYKGKEPPEASPLVLRLADDDRLRRENVLALLALGRHGVRPQGNQMVFMVNLGTAYPLRMRQLGIPKKWVHELGNVVPRTVRLGPGKIDFVTLSMHALKMR